MEAIKQRQHNIELLRILVMFSILFWHFIRHGLMNVETMSEQESYVCNVIYWLLFCHVNVFVIISGYFGIKLSFRKIVYFISYVGIYSVVISVIVSLFTQGFSIKQSIIHLLYSFSSNWWFVSIYFVLMLASPILNKALQSSTLEEKRNYLYTVGFADVILGGLLNNPVAANGFTFLHFSLMYIIGNYLNNIDFCKIKQKCLIFMYIVNVFLCFLFEKNGLWNGYNNPFVIGNAIIVFLIFVKFKINPSSIIGFLSSSCFAVYLIHDDKTYTRGIIRYIACYIYEHSNNFMFCILELLLCSITIFFLVSIIDIPIKKMCRMLSGT